MYRVEIRTGWNESILQLTTEAAYVANDHFSYRDPQHRDTWVYRPAHSYVELRITDLTVIPAAVTDIDTGGLT